MPWSWAHQDCMPMQCINIFMSRVGFSEDDTWSWQLAWRRCWFEWEKSLIKELIVMLQDSKPYIDRVYCWKWKIRKNREFSILLTYNLLHFGGNEVKIGKNYSQICEILFLLLVSNSLFGAFSRVGLNKR